jgi:histidinol-phosphate aminotransferase
MNDSGIGGRREFLHLLGIGSALALSPMNALGALSTWPAPLSGPVRLDSNENPYGPGPAARAAIVDAIQTAGRYPETRSLVQAIAARENVAAENVMLTVGATEGLSISARAFTRPDASLVTPAVSYETIATAVERLGNPVVRTPLLPSGQIDLDAMAGKAQGSGLLFVCNPNNPSGVSVTDSNLKAFADKLRASAPGATLLVGEAYHEYVGTASYATAVPWAVQAPGVLVSRTFSKLYGLAGLRLGYLIGHSDTIRAAGKHRVGLGASNVAIAAAAAALGDGKERERVRTLTREGRERTARYFVDHGWKCYTPEANYVFFESRRDIDGLRAACANKGLTIGYPYPAARTWARITIGTPDEMTTAFGVLDSVLGQG